MVSCSRWSICHGVILLFGLFAGVVALLTFFYVPSVIRKQIEETTILGSDEEGNFTETTKSWKDPRYHMSMSIYTYNVLNPDSVINVNAKPEVEEKGPYVFTEIQHKNITFAENGTRVFYRNYKTYYFNETESCQTCKLSDKVTIPNIVLQSMVDKIPSALKFIFDAVLSVEKEKAFITTTVGELIFDGYTDPLVHAICDNTFLRSFCHAQKIPDKVGLFFKKNGTQDGLYEVGTGLGNINDISRVFTYKNQTHTDAYYSDKARVIKGTDGQMFPPGLDTKNSEYLDIFVGQLCRSIQMERIGSKTYEDVPLYTYGPASSMHDIDLQKANGFCNPNTPRYFNNTYIQPKGCAPVGVMDVSSCIDGNARIYMSQPHFFGSHPALHDAIEGLAPASEDNDNTVLGIEPATAVVVFADQRTQLNVGVINGGLPSLKAMGPRIIPLIWIRELATFDAATRKQLLMLTGIRGGVFVASIVSFLLFCSAFVGTGIIIVLRSRQQATDTTPLLEETGEEEEHSMEENA